MPRFIDRTGHRYGRLTAVSYSRPKGGKQVRWLCRCDCGNEATVASTSLTTTRSCGCLHRERTSETNSTHGYARPGKVSPTYSAWVAAKGRCYNPRLRSFKDYGGRGIQMGDRWRDSFEAFVADMGEKPAGKTLDRMDVNGHYGPGNCRWATPQEQADNRRYNVRVRLGDDVLTLKQYAAAHGVTYKSLHHQYRHKKLPLDQALQRATPLP